MNGPLGQKRFGGTPAWTVAVLLGLTACGTPQSPVVDFSSRARNYGPQDYPVVYERWTRHGKVITDTESALEVWVTYKSRDYREAFVAHYVDAYSLDDADRERLRQSQREAAVAGYEFIVTAQSANYKWNDLEKKNSPWRVTLVDGSGHALVPDTLKVERLPDLFEREFFPAKTPFTKTYAVKFARGTGRDADFTGEREGLLTLRFAGPLGHADLIWTAH